MKMKPWCLSGLLFFAHTVCAEVSEVKIARQFGLGYLPLMVMERDKLVEKYAAANGVPGLTVTWSQLASGSAMNDALLSGNLDFATAGVAPFAIIWAKTSGNLDVKAVCAMNSIPMYLNTRNPNVKSVKDFTEQDKIALPTVKVSPQAIVLQMAAEQAFGVGNYAKLDPLTVSMSHPDAVAAMLSGAHEVNSHFGWEPFTSLELANPGVHTVLNSKDVLGGPATVNVIYATSRFPRENPKIYQGFVEAFANAIDIIKSDKAAAAKIYLELSKDKETQEKIVKMLNDPDFEYTMTPRRIMKYVDFMYRTGSIKVAPKSWTEMFFANVQDLDGS